MAEAFKFMEISREYTAKFFGKGPRKVVGIVLHDTAGTGLHNDTKYLANPGDGRKVSADFTVERDGTVYQLIADLKNSWSFHAGRSTAFKGLRNRDVMKSTVGIEICQKANLGLDPIWPMAQVKAVAELCVHLCKTFGLTKSDITTHAKIITDGSRSDPRKFPFNEFWAFFDGANGTPGESGRVYHTVTLGETLWKIANQYQTRIETIKALNGINEPSNLITVGQKLRVK